VKKQQLDELLNEARDESTTSQQLTNIWYSTKSSRIRKAVASNPNASPVVLRTAARLYLDEVLSNPGFELIKLFDSDPWITKLCEAYENPNEFFVKYGKYSTLGHSMDGNILTRAILMSKNLTPEALNCCLAYGQKPALDRALKNKQVFENVRFLVKESSKNNSYSYFDLGSLLILHSRKVISTEELHSCLSQFGFASTSASKRCYSDFYVKVLGEYQQEQSPQGQEFLVNLLSRFFMISRGHVFSFLRDKDYGVISSDNFLDLVARCLKHITDVSYKRNREVKNLLHEHKKWLVGTIFSKTYDKFIRNNGGSEDFDAFFAFYKEHEIIDTVIDYNRGMNFRGKQWLEKIKQTSFDTKMFLAKSGCLGDWAPVMDSDDRYRIFNELNESIYAKEGVSKNLLFSSCSLRKIVSINDSTYAF